MQTLVATKDSSPAAELAEIWTHVQVSAERRGPVAARAHPRFAVSARNLACYLALRELDVRPLQSRLARAGLSSLGRSEAHVLASLDAVRRAAGALRGDLGSGVPGPAISPGFDEGPALLDAHTEVLLAPATSRRRTRIMVTMPHEAADDPVLVRDMAAAGMDCARINLAHDDEDQWRRMARKIRAAALATGRPCRIAADLPGPKLRTGPIGRDPSGHEPKMRVFRGESLVLTAAPDPGRPAQRGESGEVVRAARISCTLPEVFTHVRPGERVFVDDGKIAAVVEYADPAELELRITGASDKGQRVRAGKGINFPQTHLPISCLTEGDLAHLPFVAECADIVEMSFVQDPVDVRALRERLAEVQEEILWLSEAAHVPVVWATEVLDNMAHTGRMTRAEVTDAAMGARAECVMLNKGACIVDAIAALDGILSRMQEHHDKKTSLLRPLRSWRQDPPDT